MTLFLTLPIPNSPLIVEFTDDDSGADKVFVTNTRTAKKGQRDCFGSFAEAIGEKGQIGSFVAGFWTIGPEERVFLQGISAIADAFTREANLAFSLNGEKPDMTLARAILEPLRKKVS